MAAGKLSPANPHFTNPVPLSTTSGAFGFEDMGAHRLCPLLVAPLAAERDRYYLQQNQHTFVI
jgi:hypothetical protein